MESWLAVIWPRRSRPTRRLESLGAPQGRTVSLARGRRWSFRNEFAGAAKLLRKIPQLWDTIMHRQDRFSIVHVNTRHEFQSGKCRREDVDQAEGWMIG